MPPVAFARNLYCVSARLTRTCRATVYFDIASHHPYAIAGPGRHALNADDVAIPDYRKLARLVRRGVQLGSIAPRNHKRFWVTEISWDSRPPDPYGVPIAQHARWLEESFYSLWRQGVDTVLWLQVVDAPPVPSFDTTYQAGVFFQNGNAKPAATAFHFPFVAHRIGGKVRYWLVSPETGQITIQTKVSGQWRTSVRRNASAGQVITGETSAIRGNLLRAAAGAQHSLDWRL
jgi:hypothetical protein